ncbi:iron ABC transporter permease [Thiotrichales bacterium 19S3-7]|nr:iron ABC transporter permease [Thiotrichales bacterium 19S3-7]MCF6802180.1 iron ABC transporter permease [Thiotrichales bacterium 19S3-11]
MSNQFVVYYSEKLNNVNRLLLLVLALVMLIVFWLFISLLQQPVSMRLFVLNEFILPRVILDVCCGFLFAIAGSLLQATLKNQMASPEILGLTSSAILMVFIASVIGISYCFEIYYLFALLGASLAIILTWNLARKNAKVAILELVLVGSGIAVFAKALLQLFAVNMPPEMTALLSFMSGSTYHANWQVLIYLMPLTGIIMLCAIMLSQKINLLWLDELTAKSIGLAIDRLRMLVLSLSVFATATAIMGAGNLGFVGLIAPNMAYLLAKNHRHWLIIYAVLLGAILVVFADMLNAVVFNPVEIPAGLITTIIGTPYFIWLLRK